MKYKFQNCQWFFLTKKSYCKNNYLYLLYLVMQEDKCIPKMITFWNRNKFIISCSSSISVFVLENFQQRSYTKSALIQKCLEVSDERFALIYS